MSPFDGARCVGQWRLFDSTSPKKHAEAKLRCDECPALAACGALAAAHFDLRRSLVRHGGGLVGTWAGRLYGNSPTSRIKAREHGTQRGYDQHRWHGDKVCDECRAAHARKAREVA